VRAQGTTEKAQQLLEAYKGLIYWPVNGMPSYQIKTFQLK